MSEAQRFWIRFSECEHGGDMDMYKEDVHRSGGRNISSGEVDMDLEECQFDFEVPGSLEDFQKKFKRTDSYGFVIGGDRYRTKKEMADELRRLNPNLPWKESRMAGPPGWPGMKDPLRLLDRVLTTLEDGKAETEEEIEELGEPGVIFVEEEDLNKPSPPSMGPEHPSSPADPSEVVEYKAEVDRLKRELETIRGFIRDGREILRKRDSSAAEKLLDRIGRQFNWAGAPKKFGSADLDSVLDMVGRDSDGIRKVVAVLRDMVGDE